MPGPHVLKMMILLGPDFRADRRWVPSQMAGLNMQQTSPGAQFTNSVLVNVLLHVLLHVAHVLHVLHILLVESHHALHDLEVPSLLVIKTHKTRAKSSQRGGPCHRNAAAAAFLCLTTRCLWKDPSKKIRKEAKIHCLDTLLFFGPPISAGRSVWTLLSQSKRSVPF